MEALRAHAGAGVAGPRVARLQAGARRAGRRRAARAGLCAEAEGSYDIVMSLSAAGGVILHAFSLDPDLLLS